MRKNSGTERWPFGNDIGASSSDAKNALAAPTFACIAQRSSACACAAGRVRPTNDDCEDHYGYDVHHQTRALRCTGTARARLSGRGRGEDADWLAQSPATNIDGGIVETVSDAAVQGDGSVAWHADAGPQGIQVRPGAAFIARVTANGTGCPRGSWYVDIGPDSETLTATFSKYEATVEDGSRVSFKDCNLSVQMHSRRDVSYAVAEFYAQGYAFLEPGVRGFFTASYYTQGNPIPSTATEDRTDLSGPVDRSFLVQHAVRQADMIWTPCGLDRNLQIVTRIGLQKSQNKGLDYINLSSIDERTDGKVVVRIKTRRCS